MNENRRYWTTAHSTGWPKYERVYPSAKCVECGERIRPIDESWNRWTDLIIGGWSHVEPFPTLCIDPHPYAVPDREVAEPRQYYIGSMGYRYDDPNQSFLATTSAAVETALDAAVEWENNDMPGYCEHDKPGGELCDAGCDCIETGRELAYDDKCSIECACNGWKLAKQPDDGLCTDDCPDCGGSECSLCHPDLVTYGVWPETARELGLSVRWWQENRRAIVKGEAVYGDGD